MFFDDYGTFTSYARASSVAVAISILALCIIIIYLVISLVMKIRLAKELSISKGYNHKTYMWLTALVGIAPILVLCFSSNKKEKNKDSNNNMKECSGCGKSVAVDKKFCPFCGKTFQIMPYFTGLISYLTGIIVFCAILIVLIWYVSGKLCAYFATNRGLEEKKWFWLGFFCGPCALFAVNYIPIETSSVINDYSEKTETLNFITEKTCHNCGKSVDISKKFCPFCGTKF